MKCNAVAHITLKHQKFKIAFMLQESITSEQAVQGQDGLEFVVSPGDGSRLLYVAKKKQCWNIIVGVACFYKSLLE